MKFTLRASSGSISVDGGTISGPPSAPDFELDLGSGRFHPGLINGHDHLYLNHYGRLGSPPYDDAYEWASDVQSQFAVVIRRASTLSRDDALYFGALKNLMGGVTTVVHHDRWSPLLDRGFPVRVARVRVVHSLGLEEDIDNAVAGDRSSRGLPLSMHLAEGTSAEIAAEVHEATRRGIVGDQLVAVHLVGADEAGIDQLQQAGAAAVWCPTSNLFLYGKTAPPELFESSIDILLGTDSLLSAQGTMLDELRAARELQLLSDTRLLEATGVVAARRLGLALPSLAPGGAADLIFVRRSLFDAQPADIGLVLVGGKPVFGDLQLGELFERSGVPAELIVVGGQPKLVAAPLGTVAERVLSLVPDSARILGVESTFSSAAGASSVPPSRPLRRTPFSRVSQMPVLGIPVRFETNSAAVCDIVESSFGAWRSLDAHPELISSQSVRVRVFVEDGEEQADEPVPIRYRLPDNDRLLVSAPGSFCVAEVARREACAFVTTALVADASHFQVGVMEALTFFLVTGPDRYPIHAATVTRGDTTILLSGPSGAGKSTLAYAAQRDGFLVRGEDVAYVQLEGGFRVWTAPRAIRLPPDAVGYFPELEGVGDSRLANGKRKLIVPTVAEEAVTPVSDRVEVCLLTRSGGEACLERVGSEELERALATNLAPGFDRFPRSTREVAARLAVGGGWRLHISPDPAESIRLLQEIVGVGVS